MSNSPIRRWRQDSGMAVAEYAVATVAACGFAGVLWKILTGDWAREFLLDILERIIRSVF